MIYKGERLSSSLQLSDPSDRVDLSMAVPSEGKGYPIITLVQDFKDRPISVVTIWEEDILRIAEELIALRAEAKRIETARIETSECGL